MAIRFLLTLKPSSPPHLYLDQIKELIAHDDELLPQMRKCLLILKKYKKTYIQLPLQTEVILIPEDYCHIERSLNPTFGAYTKTKWSVSDIESYKTDSQNFMFNIKRVYDKMGYHVEEFAFDTVFAQELAKKATLIE